MASNAGKMKVRDLDPSNLKALIQSIEVWSDRLALYASRRELVAGAPDTTDSPPVNTTPVAIDFSKDGAPAQAIGARVSWFLDANTDAMAEWSPDNVTYYAEGSFHTSTGTVVTISAHFGGGTQTAYFRLSGSPAVITTNTLKITAWMF